MQSTLGYTSGVILDQMSVMYPLTHHKYVEKKKELTDWMVCGTLPPSVLHP